MLLRTVSLCQRTVPCVKLTSCPKYFGCCYRNLFAVSRPLICSRYSSFVGLTPFRVRYLQLGCWRGLRLHLRRLSGGGISGGQKAAEVIKTSGTVPKASDLVQLLKLAKPERFKIAAAILLLLVSSSVSVSVPFFMGKLIDIIFGKSDDGDSAESTDDAKGEAMLRKLLNVCVFLTGVFLVGAACNFGRYYILDVCGNRVINRLRMRVFSSILSQEIGFFDKTKTGELVNRLSNDASRVGYSVTMNVSDGLRSLVSACGGVGMMTYVSPQLTLVSLSMVAPITIGAVIYGRYIRRITQRINDALARATEVAEERLSNIRTVRAFSAEGKEDLTYDTKIFEVMKLARKNALATGLFYGCTGLSGNLIMISVLYAGGSMMTTSLMTVGELSSFLLYAVYVGVSIGGLSSFYTELMRGLGSSSRLFELIGRRPLIPLSGGLIPEAINGRIELRNVTFAYPERPGSNIFSDLSLDIPPGSVTAIVGHSGSGKTTVASLLLRYYDPLAGQLLLDGQDIRSLDPSWLRRSIGTVSQEPVLFSGTVKENITYGAERPDDVTDSEIEEAARKANALAFINKFSKGFDTLVGERGVTLSGGQRQRIAIARALLKDPKILLFDEATSALDAESEYLVREALDRLIRSGKRTIIIIAHRLSTIKYADQIAVLSDGRVAELGTFSELLAIEDGRFRKLVHRQTLDDGTL